MFSYWFSVHVVGVLPYNHVVAASLDDGALSIPSIVPVPPNHVPILHVLLNVGLLALQTIFENEHFCDRIVKELATPAYRPIVVVNLPDPSECFVTYNELNVLYWVKPVHSQVLLLHHLSHDEAWCKLVGPSVFTVLLLQLGVKNRLQSCIINFRGDNLMLDLRIAL